MEMEVKEDAYLDREELEQGEHEVAVQVGADLAGQVPVSHPGARHTSATTTKLQIFLNFLSHLFFREI